MPSKFIEPMNDSDDEGIKRNLDDLKPKKNNANVNANKSGQSIFQKSKFNKSYALSDQKIREFQESMTKNSNNLLTLSSKRESKVLDKVKKYIQ
jgi:hypothetical protein